MNLGSLNVRIGVDTHPLQQGLTSAKGQVEAFTRSVGSSSQGLSAVERAFGATGASAGKLSQGLTGAAASSTGLSRALIQIGNSSRIAGVGLGALGVAGAVATAFGAAVKASFDFNREMANVGAISDRGAEHLKALKTSVQDLAVSTGQNTGELAKGLYQVVSAFGDTAESAAQLALTTKLAIGGVSTVEHALALTSAVTKAYGDTSTAAQKAVADLSLETVKLGQTRLPELAGAIGLVTPLAAALKVSQQELFAVMATGTGVTGTASQVATQYRGILQSLFAPTKEMTALFKRAGVASGEALIEQRGFQGALQLVVNTANETHTPLQKYIQQIEGQTLALSLAGPQAQKFTSNLKEMGGAAGETDRAFDKQQKGINAAGVEWDKFRQALVTGAQQVGDQIAESFGKQSVSALTSFVVWLTKAEKGVAGLLDQKEALLKRAGEGIADTLYTGVKNITSPIFAPMDAAKRHQEMAQRVREAMGADPYMRGLAQSVQGPPAAFPQGSRFPRGAGPAGAAPTTPEQEAAHKKVIAVLEGQAFDTARQKAVQFHGELSKQVAALDLYRQAWEKLTGGQQKSALALLASEKAEDRSRAAVKAGEDAVTARAKAEQKAADEKTRAAQKAKAERERIDADYKAYMAQTNQSIRDQNQFTQSPMGQFKLDHPDWSPARQKKAFDATQFNEFQKAAKASSEAAKQEENQINLTMGAKLKSAQLDANSAQAQRKYGEINRETLALQSDWAKSYLELAPNQQQVIDGLYQLALAKQANEQQDRIAKAQQDQTLKDSEARWQADLKEKDALLDLAKAMEKRRREADKAKQDDFDRQLKDLGDKLNKPDKRAQEALDKLAGDTQQVFENAFHDAYEHGPKAFFASVIAGFEQMLQQMAAKYLASQLVNFLFGAADLDTGERSGGVLGKWLTPGRRAAGGPVQAAHRYMVGEQGPEMFVAPANGRIVPHSQLAGAGGGGGNVTINFHVSTPDVGGFRSNQKALIGDAARSARRAMQRDG